MRIVLENLHFLLVINQSGAIGIQNERQLNFPFIRKSCEMDLSFQIEAFVTK